MDAATAATIVLAAASVAVPAAQALRVISRLEKDVEEMRREAAETRGRVRRLWKFVVRRGRAEALNKGLLREQRDDVRDR